MLGHEIFDSLREVLVTSNVSQTLIDAVRDSGFYLRDWVDPFSGRTWQTVSDMMYGNKQFSSSFSVSEFVAYIEGRYSFPSLPPFQRYVAKSVSDIHDILCEPRRANYIAEGSLTFRGQPNEYKYKRAIPSPVRADAHGYEISILPGAYRQRGEYYSFSTPYPEEWTFSSFLEKLEPSNPEIYFDSWNAPDIIRTEQHYATQTAGLDVAFEIDSALFFATNRFRMNSAGMAYYEPVPYGEHNGHIYCLRFRDPSVKRTEHFIKDFNLFKTFPPLRVIRQECGLLYLGPHERNIAITDIDCIIQLHPEFSLPASLCKRPEFMFPAASEDSFYRVLLGLRDQHPKLLDNVVEYVWARG